MGKENFPLELLAAMGIGREDLIATSSDDIEFEFQIEGLKAHIYEVYYQPIEGDNVLVFKTPRKCFRIDVDRNMNRKERDRVLYETFSLKDFALIFFVPSGFLPRLCEIIFKIENDNHQLWKMLYMSQISPTAHEKLEWNKRMKEAIDGYKEKHDR